MTSLAALRSLAFMCVALALLIGATGMGLGVRAFVARSHTAPGVVTRLLAGPSHPEVRFSTGDAQVVDVPQGGLIFGYAPGRTVRVRYDPAAPRASARLDEAGALWGPTTLVAVIGLLLLLAGAVPLLTTRGGGAVGG